MGVHRALVHTGEITVVDGGPGAEIVFDFDALSVRRAGAVVTWVRDNLTGRPRRAEGVLSER